jgi:hypothetical protein
MLHCVVVGSGTKGLGLFIRKFCASFIAVFALVQTNPAAVCFAETVPSTQDSPAATPAAIPAATPAAIPAASAESSSASPLVKLTIAADETTKSQIDDLTKKILREEIRLERFNIRYRTEVAKQGRLKSFRYFISQQTNATATVAGVIATVDIRTSLFHHSDKLHSAPLERATLPAFPGQIIGASGSALEFWINEYHRWQADRMGFSPAAARTFVLASRERISRLMAEREALVEAEKSSPTLKHHYAIDAKEGEILTDIRDIALHEFVAYHVGQRKYLAFQQCLYVFDILKNSSGAVGTFLAYEANHEHRRRFNLASGVFSTISGALVMGTPVISRVYGKLIAEREKRFISVVDQGLSPDQIELGQDLEDLHKLCTDSGQKTARRTIGRFALYQDDKKDFDQELQESARELRAGRLAATETISTGLYAGATKVALNIEYIIAGNRYFNNVRVTNYLLGSGAVVYLTGASAAMLDNLRIQITSEFVNAKLRRKHLLPSQLLRDRLKDLDEMEALLGPAT